MKRLLIYVAILVVAIIAGLFLARDPGYVMFSYGKWSMETSIWFLIIAVIILFIILWLIASVLRSIYKTPHRVGKWRKGKRQDKAHSLTSDGVLALHEGEWKEAESLLIKGVKSSAIPVVNFLSAARAAQEQLAYERRDFYLSEAMRVDKKEKIAIDLMRAKLQLEHHQLEFAKETLKALKQEAPKHPYVTKLIFQLHVLNHNWERILGLLPKLRKLNVLDEEELNKYTYRSVHHLLHDENKNLEEVESLWKSLPKVTRARHKILISYVKRLLDFDEHEKAAKLISSALKSRWDDELVLVFAQVKMNDADRQLEIVDGWLSQQGSSPILFETIAAVALHAKAWAIAKTYAERALRIQKTPEAFAVLAIAAENLGEDALMTSALRQGLLLQCAGTLGVD